MIKGLYTAGTAMVSKSHKMDVMSNNLANINTAGYKRDGIVTESFNDRLITKMNGEDLILEGPIKDVQFNKSGDFYEARTENGYFRVSTQFGVHHGKEMKFTVDKSGYLMVYSKVNFDHIDESYNQTVLDTNGKAIFIGDNEFEMNDKGQIVVNNQVIADTILHPNINVIGTLNGGVKSEKLYTDFSQGILNPTGNATDMALQGEGFFIYLDSNENEFYSRNGTVSINQYGELVNLQGYKLKGYDGKPIVLDGIDFKLNEFGELVENGQVVNKIQTVNFTNTGDIYKIGGNMYRKVENLEGEMAQFEGVIHQGMTESANVDSISEMIRVIETNRNYESCQKVVSTIDELIGQSINKVAVVNK